MKRVLLSFLSLTTLLLVSCTAPLRFTPATGFPEANETIEGKAWLVSRQRDQVAVRYLESPKSQRNVPPAFVIRITNARAGRLLLSLGDVSATSGDQPVRLYTAQERATEIKRNARLRSLAIEAERHEDEERAQNKPLFQAASLPSPGPTMKAQESLLRLNHSAHEAWSSIGDMLDQVAIRPAGTASVLVMLHAEDILAGQPLTLIVRLGGETHTFHFIAITGDSPATTAGR